MSIARNTAINLAGAGTLIVVSLVTVPLYLRFVGIERFGVLSICWLLLGYLGLFDLGLGRAVTQGIAALPPDRRLESDALIWTGLWTSAALGALAFAVALPVGHLALSAMSFETADLAAEAGRAVPWIACAVPVNMLAGIFSGALIGRQRFGTVNAIDVGSSIVATAAPLVIAALGHPELPALVATSVSARLISTATAALAARRLVPVGAPRRPSRELLRGMLTFGGWVSVSNAVGPILSMWDRFVIGVMLGARSVSVYVIPFSVISRLLILPEALHRALFPRLSSLEPNIATGVARNSVGALCVIMTPIALAAMVVVFPFFRLWIGDALAPEAAVVAYLLLPGIWANALALVAFALLHAQRRASVSAKLHCAEVIPYVLMLWAALTYIGLPGAAAVWSLRTIIDAWAMFRLSAAGTGALASARAPFVVVLSSAAAALLLTRGGVAQLVTLAALLALGTAVAWRSAPPVAREWALSAVLRLRARITRESS